MLLWQTDPEIKRVGKEILSVIQILINEELWCRRALARDKDDNQLFDPKDEKACSWCIYGALYMIDAGPKTIAYLQSMAKSLGWSDLDRLNDLNQHFFVMQFLKESVEALGMSYKIKLKRL